MGLDAGTVKSQLNLDTTSFKEGFSEAHTHAESEGGQIREVLESIAEMATEVCGPAFGELGQEIQSIFGGFSEGPLVGAMNAVAVAAGQLRESAASTVDELHNIGIESKKAGVDIDWLDKMAEVGKTANVSLEQLGQGLRIIEERGEAAEQGDKKAMESFNKLGISATQLSELLKEPQKLFDQVHDSLGNMTDASMRQTEAHDVLGRAGAALIPLFSMSKQQFDDLAQTMDKLSGGANDASVETANSVFILEKEIGAAFAGIEKVASKPILKFLQNHASEILPAVEALVEHVEAGITTAWSAVASASDAIVPGLEEIWGEIKTNLSPAFNKAEEDAKALWPMFRQVAGTLYEDLKPALKEIIPILGAIEGAFESVAAGAIKHFLNGLHELEPFIKRMADAVAALMGHIKEGFQIIGSITGYYDNPNDFSGDAGQATRGLSRDQINDKLSGSLVAGGSGGGLSPHHVEALRQSIDDLNSHISNVVNRSGSPQSFQEGDGVGSPPTGDSGKPLPGQPAGQTLNVNVVVHPEESAAQIAAKIVPYLKKMKKDRSQEIAGTAMQAAAESSMGGD